MSAYFAIDVASKENRYENEDYSNVEENVVHRGYEQHHHIHRTLHERWKGKTMKNVLLMFRISCFVSEKRREKMIGFCRVLF